MIPLRDQKDSGDPVIARAARLVRSAQPGEVAETVRAPRRAPRPRAAKRLLLLGAFAAVGAASARFFDGANEAPPVPIAAARPEPKPAPPVAISRTALAPSSWVVVPPAPPPRRKTNRTTAVPQTTAEVPSAQTSQREEAELMMRALRAFRVDRDTRAAREWIAAYRSRFPSGELREEALALLLEVASHERSADLPEIASTYLREFPAGAFRPLAESAVEGSADRAP
jgi:hypothetical protein